MAVNLKVTLQLLLLSFLGHNIRAHHTFYKWLFSLKQQRPLEAIYFHLEETAGHLAFYVRAMSTLTLCCHLISRNWIISPSHWRHHANWTWTGKNVNILTAVVRYRGWKMNPWKIQGSVTSLKFWGREGTVVFNTLQIHLSNEVHISATL